MVACRTLRINIIRGLAWLLHAPLLVLPIDENTLCELCVHFLRVFCAFAVRVIFNNFRALLFLFFQAGTELSKQESAYKEVKSTQRKIVEKRGEYAARASEISENQRRLIRSVSVESNTWYTVRGGIGGHF